MNRVLKFVVSALGAIALALLLFGRAGAAAPAKPVTHHVTIEAMQFQPDVLPVKAGDSIVWTNKDFFPHTVTSKAGGFDSHEIKSGETWTYKVSKAGDVTYVCTLHPTMKATLRVK